MDDAKVMRSVYLGVAEDNQLRQIAFDAKLSKSDLIRAAIAVALHRWDEMDDSLIREEVAAAQRLGEEEPLTGTGKPPEEPSPAALSVPRMSRRHPDRKTEKKSHRTRPTTEAKQTEHQHRELANPDI